MHMRRFWGKCRRGVAMFFAVFILLGSMASPAYADPDGTPTGGEETSSASFYKLTSAAAGYLNDVLAKNNNDVGSDLGGLDSTSAGGLLGYCQEADQAGKLFGWIDAPMSTSSSTYSYWSLSRKGTGDCIGETTGKGAMLMYAAYGRTLAVLGLDKTSSESSLSIMIGRPLAGNAMKIVYSLSTVINMIFRTIINFLQFINPFRFFHKPGTNTPLVDGVDPIDDTSPLKPLSDFVSDMYDAIAGTGSGVYLFAVTIAFAFLMYNLLVTKKDKTFEIKKYVWRCLFIIIGVPLCGSLYTTALDWCSDALLADSCPATSIIASHFVDFEGWAANGRLTTTGISTNIRSTLTVPLSDSDDDSGVVNGQGISVVPVAGSVMGLRGTTLSINSRYSPSLSGNMDTVDSSNASIYGTGTSIRKWNTSMRTNTDSDATSQKVVNAVTDILERYASSSFYYASNWETTAKSGIEYESVKEEIQKTDNVNDWPSSGESGQDGYQYITSGGTFWYGGGSLGNAYSFTGNYYFDSNPGLSIMSMYNYLNSKFTASGVIVYSSDKAASGFSRESHFSVNLIGTGLLSFLYGLNAFVLIVVIVALGLFYGIGLIMANVKRTLQVITSIPFAAMGSLRFGAKLLAHSIMMIVEVVVTIIVYNVAAQLIVVIPAVLEATFSSILGSASLNADDAIDVVTNLTSVTFGGVPYTISGAPQTIFGGVALVTIQLLLSLIITVVLGLVLIKYRRTAVRAVDEIVADIINKFVPGARDSDMIQPEKPSIGDRALAAGGAAAGAYIGGKAAQAIHGSSDGSESGQAASDAEGQGDGEGDNTTVNTEQNISDDDTVEASDGDFSTDGTVAGDEADVPEEARAQIEGSGFNGNEHEIDKAEEDAGRELMNQDRLDNGKEPAAVRDDANLGFVNGQKQLDTAEELKAKAEREGAAHTAGDDKAGTGRSSGRKSKDHKARAGDPATSDKDKTGSAKDAALLAAGGAAGAAAAGLAGGKGGGSEAVAGDDALSADGTAGDDPSKRGLNAGEVQGLSNDEKEAMLENSEEDNLAEASEELTQENASRQEAMDMNEAVARAAEAQGLNTDSSPSEQDYGEAAAMQGDGTEPMADSYLPKDGQDEAVGSGTDIAGTEKGKTGSGMDVGAKAQQKDNAANTAKDVAAKNSASGELTKSQADYIDQTVDKEMEKINGAVKESGASTTAEKNAAAKAAAMMASQPEAGARDAAKAALEKAGVNPESEAGKAAVEQAVSDAAAAQGRSGSMESTAMAATAAVATVAGAQNLMDGFTDAQKEEVNQRVSQSAQQKLAAAKKGATKQAIAKDAATNAAQAAAKMTGGEPNVAKAEEIASQEVQAAERNLDMYGGNASTDAGHSPVGHPIGVARSTAEAAAKAANGGAPLSMEQAEKARAAGVAAAKSVEDKAISSAKAAVEASGGTWPADGTAQQKELEQSIRDSVSTDAAQAAACAGFESVTGKPMTKAQEAKVMEGAASQFNEIKAANSEEAVAARTAERTMQATLGAASATAQGKRAVTEAKKSARGMAQGRMAAATEQAAASAAASEEIARLGGGQDAATGVMVDNAVAGSLGKSKADVTAQGMSYAAGTAAVAAAGVTGAKAMAGKEAAALQGIASNSVEASVNAGSTAKANAQRQGVASAGAADIRSGAGTVSGGQTRETNGQPVAGGNFQDTAGGQRQGVDMSSMSPAQRQQLLSQQAVEAARSGNTPRPAGADAAGRMGAPSGGSVKQQAGGPAAAAAVGPDGGSAASGYSVQEGAARRTTTTTTTVSGATAAGGKPGAQGAGKLSNKELMQYAAMVGAATFMASAPGDGMVANVERSAGGAVGTMAAVGVASHVMGGRGPGQSGQGGPVVTTTTTTVEESAYRNESGAAAAMGGQSMAAAGRPQGPGPNNTAGTAPSGPAGSGSPAQGFAPQGPSGQAQGTPAQSGQMYNPVNAGTGAAPAPNSSVGAPVSDAELAGQMRQEAGQMHQHTQAVNANTAQLLQKMAATGMSSQEIQQAILKVSGGKTMVPTQNIENALKTGQMMNAAEAKTSGAAKAGGTETRVSGGGAGASRTGGGTVPGRGRSVQDASGMGGAVNDGTGTSFETRPGVQGRASVQTGQGKGIDKKAAAGVVLGAGIAGGSITHLQGKQDKMNRQYQERQQRVAQEQAMGQTASTPSAQGAAPKAQPAQVQQAAAAKVAAGQVMRPGMGMGGMAAAAGVMGAGRMVSGTVSGVSQPGQPSMGQPGQTPGSVPGQGAGFTPGYPGYTPPGQSAAKTPITRLGEGETAAPGAASVYRTEGGYRRVSRTDSVIREGAETQVRAEEVDAEVQKDVGRRKAKNAIKQREIDARRRKAGVRETTSTTVTDEAGFFRTESGSASFGTKPGVRQMKLNVRRNPQDEVTGEDIV